MNNIFKLEFSIVNYFIKIPQFSFYKTIGNYHLAYFGWLFFEIFIKIGKVKK